MKITIDVSQMAYQGTGVGRYTYELVQALLRAGTVNKFKLWAGSLRQHSFFANLSRLEPWDHAAWVYSPLPPKLAALVFNYTPLPFELFAGSSDLIHTSDWSAPTSALPAVTTVHDLAFHYYPETIHPLILRTQRRRLAKLSSQKTHLIVDSVSTQKDLMKIYNIEPTRINVIYPGLSADYQPPSNKEIDRVKTKYKLPDQYLLALGTREPRKNLPRLIQAAKNLSLNLVIAGRYGWGKQTPIPSNVQILGYVPDNDLPALYNLATVFVYPSLYEGFGFPVLEAMACGTAVVTSNTSSLPEVAGEAAILVDPLSLDSIAQGIIQAKSQRKSLINKGLVQAQKFSWGQTAQKVMEVYDKIIVNSKA